MVAILGLLLDHTPPDDGKTCVVPLIQMDVGPLMVAIGVVLTVTGVDANEVQPVVALVKVKVAAPVATPVTVPLLVTVAILGLLLIQVPPLDGLNDVVVPMHIWEGPVIDTLGLPLTVINSVASDGQPAEDVNRNEATPCDTPVTMPFVLMVAIEALLLVQTPPVEGKKEVVAPTHTVLPPDNVTVGLGLTVIGDVFTDSQPVAASMNFKVALPALKPTTIPEFVVFTIDVLLLIQVPPVAGYKVVVPPIHIDELPTTLTVGLLYTAIFGLFDDTQPVAASVNLNVTLPLFTAVIVPELVMVAMEVLLLSHVPPEFGSIDVVPPIHKAEAPVMEILGLGLTVRNVVVTA